MNIFENLEKLQISEECFNDILILVEEYINELKITDKALKVYMNKNYKKGVKAGNSYDTEFEKFEKRQKADIKNKAKDFTYVSKDGREENDVEQEERLYPQETAQLRKKATDFRQGIDRYHRARERYNKRHPEAPIKSKIKSNSSSLNHSTNTWAQKYGSSGKKEHLYDGSVNHWGNGSWK
jgi:hypothetical protein